MTTDPKEMTNEEIALLFHETYERLAPSFGYETRADTKKFDKDSKNGRLMVAVCGEVAKRLRALPATGASAGQAGAPTSIKPGSEWLKIGRNGSFDLKKFENGKWVPGEFAPDGAAQLAQARADCQAARVEAEKAKSELASYKNAAASLQEIHATPGAMEANIKLSPELSQFIGQVFAELVASSPNYTEMRFDPKPVESSGFDFITVTVQKRKGKTPHQLRTAAEERVKVLEAACLAVVAISSIMEIDGPIVTVGPGFIKARAMCNAALTPPGAGVT